jgi:glycogen synthase
MKDEGTTTIRGIVIPAIWNEKGDIVTVAIATYLEETYLVAEGAMGQRLRSLLKKRVVVEGVVNQQDTHRTIEVKKVKIDKTKP